MRRVALPAPASRAWTHQAAAPATADFPRPGTAGSTRTALCAARRSGQNVEYAQPRRSSARSRSPAAQWPSPTAARSARKPVPTASPRPTLPASVSAQSPTATRRLPVPLARGSLWSWRPYRRLRPAARNPRSARRWSSPAPPARSCTWQASSTGWSSGRAPRRYQSRRPETQLRR